MLRKLIDNPDKIHIWLFPNYSLLRYSHTDLIRDAIKCKRIKYIIKDRIFSVEGENGYLQLIVPRKDLSDLRGIRPHSITVHRNLYLSLRDVHELNHILALGGDKLVFTK